MGVRAAAAFVLVSACSSGPIPLGLIQDPGTTDAGSAATDAGGPCTVPVAVRHYPFDGTGIELVDARGGGSAHLLGGAVLDGSGVVRLDGVDDYVDLPNGLLAGLDEVTVAVWVQRRGGPAYTRIFDIGTGSLGEDPADDAVTVGRSYLAATPGTGNVPSQLAALMSDDGTPGEVIVASDVDLDDAQHLVVVVVSATSLSLFDGGVLLARLPPPAPLSSIVDHNAWLGRSQYSADPYLTADFADLRLFDRALSECEVRALYQQGSAPP